MISLKSCLIISLVSSSQALMSSARIPLLSGDLPVLSLLIALCSSSVEISGILCHYSFHVRSHFFLCPRRVFCTMPSWSGTSHRRVLLRTWLIGKGAQSSTRGGIVGPRIAATTAMRIRDQALMGSRSRVFVLPRVSCQWKIGWTPVFRLENPNTFTPSGPNFLAKIVDVRRSDSKCGSSQRASGSLHLFPMWCPWHCTRVALVAGETRCTCHPQTRASVHLGSCFSSLPSARCGRPAPSTCLMWWRTPSSSSHKCCGLPVCKSCEWTSNNLLSIALR